MNYLEKMRIVADKQGIYAALEQACAKVDELREQRDEWDSIAVKYKAELDEARKDSERLDWMQEHAASVEVNDEEVLHCTVQASDDYQAEGKADPYDIRAAIDAARAQSGAPERKEAT